MKKQNGNTIGLARISLKAETENSKNAPSLGFNDFGTEAYFWTSENNSKEATNYIISNQRVGSSIIKKNYRYSCRCVKD